MQNPDIQDIIQQEKERLGSQAADERSYRRAAKTKGTLMAVICAVLLLAAAAAGVFMVRHVRQARETFDTAEAYAVDGEYISAVRTFASIGKASVRHEQAVIRIQELYDEYFGELQALITQSMETGSIAYRQPLREGAEYYPQSEEIAALLKADGECGDPLLYNMSDTVFDNISTIEYVEDRPHAKCTVLRFTAISRTEALIEAYFQEGEGETQTSFSLYFTVTADEVRDMTADEYVQALGTAAPLEIPWNNSEWTNKKEQAIYDGLTKAIQLYGGEITAEDTQAPEEAPPEDDDDGGGTDFLLIPIIALVPVVFSFWVIRKALRMIFGK